MNTLFAANGPGKTLFASLSRREFLRQTSQGLLGLFTLPLIEKGLGRQKTVYTPDPNVPEIGRVLDNSVAVYKEPSFSSKMVRMYWRDVVLPITGVTVGDKEPSYNRVWYLINNEGYAHSGKVQPVAIERNQTVDALPEKGALFEVTVPFTDALTDPNRPDWFVYRLYYSTVHWVYHMRHDDQGRLWYEIQDDKYRHKVYYVLAEHLRRVTEEDLTPLSPRVPASEKRIEVRLKDQVVIAYEEDRPVFMTRVASGGRFIDGNYSTPVGTYMTSRKRPSRHMASEDLAAQNSFDLPGVPWVCYLTLRGISFHGTYWHNDFGKPRSHGCLNVSPQAARWIYRWTLPNVPTGEKLLETDAGTRVDVVD